LPAETPSRSRQYKVHGLDCAEEVSALRREIGPLAGGDGTLSFDILQGKMTVPADVPAERIQRAVAAAGLRAEPWREPQRGQPARSPDNRARWLAAAASGGLTLAGLGAQLAGGTTTSVAIPLYVLAVLSGVAFVLPKAWLALRRLRPDMNLLMTVAVCGAMAIEEWFEAATVSCLFALSLALEAWSVGRARRAVAALLDLTPATARVIDATGERQTPVEAVTPGTRFVVHAGERIPLDGSVASGASDVNQAPITGESLPVSKGPGDDVFAGTINGAGTLEVVSSRAADDTTLAHIIQMVGQAQTRRAPSEQWVERFARVYTPTVMLLAVAALVLPPLLFDRGWTDSLYGALVLLVIACPCALVIATPVAVVAALASAARQGVLIKGGLHVETPASLRAIAFDKTGTLTTGDLHVVELVPLDGHDERELLFRAAALEARSGHPIARAILLRAKQDGVYVVAARDVRTLPGRGVAGDIDGREFWLGSHRYLEERNEETPEVHRRLEQMAGEGRSVVVVGNERHVCGLLALADRPRPNAREALGALRALGIEHIALLTGDNRATAAAVGAAVGADEVLAELLPEEKVAEVERLVARFGRVAMVGDGVNDAPALARATLGIAMGAAGSDAAIETADVALMSDDLERLPWLVRHSRRTLRIVRANIAFALATKALFVALAFAGHSSLWLAIAADTGAALLVIANALRLLRNR